MKLTSTELQEALDRAIDRALRQVFSDDWSFGSAQRCRMNDVIRAEVDELERNLFDNDQGFVRFQVDLVYRGPRAMPGLLVSGGRIIFEHRGQLQ